MVLNFQVYRIDKNFIVVKVENTKKEDYSEFQKKDYDLNRELKKECMIWLFI